MGTVLGQGAAGRGHGGADVGGDEHLLQHRVGVPVAVGVEGAVARLLRVPAPGDVVLLQKRQDQDQAYFRRLVGLRSDLP